MNAPNWLGRSWKDEQGFPVADVRRVARSESRVTADRIVSWTWTDVGLANATWSTSGADNGFYRDRAHGLAAP